ncbi:MAG: OmpA family protein [Myxococcales bacterium]|nr:OmpA family protein [Myxococcales bacterium]
MRPRFVASLVVVVCALVAAGACDRAPDLARYREQALSMAAQYAPQVTELRRQAAVLAARWRAIPPDVPGHAPVGAALARADGALASLSEQVAQLPGQTTDAIKSGKRAPVAAVLDQISTTVTTGLVEVGDDLATTERALAQLEVAARAQAGFAATLSTGVEIKGATRGVERQLLAVIGDAARPVDQTSWFELDRLVFVAGGAELEPAGSRDQLGNLAEILKAFPSLRLTIGGYADDASAGGTRAARGRADAVVRALVGLGVAAARLQAEGLGAAACPANDTDACRAQHRRVAVRVTAK